MSDEGFTPPGSVKVSDAALQFAIEFDKTVNATQRGDWVVAFDWAHEISIRRTPTAPSESIGACLTLGAFRRHQIPPGFTQTVEGLEFAIKIPREIWEQSAERLIDVDKNSFFRLALR